MPRFDVFANPTAGERKHTPYFLDVQNDYIDHLETRVVIPLRRESASGTRARDLHPLLHVNGEPVVLDTAAIGVVPRAELRKQVAQVRESSESVQAAMDALFGAH
jgi:toxin CcdB